MLRQLSVFLVLSTIALPASAQEHSGHMAAQPIDLPAVCLTGAGDGSMAPMSGMAMDHAGPHPDLMAGMDEMNAQMMAGATAADIDVAFVCSMIPHHRGAIAMAEAELASGDDPWARSLAEAIIAAQEQEIADMLEWLSRQ